MEKTDKLTQVIEDGGQPVSSGLCIKDPHTPKGCVFGDSNCIVDKNQQCDKMGVIYNISCLTCKTMLS